MAAAAWACQYRPRRLLRPLVLLLLLRLRLLRHLQRHLCGCCGLASGIAGPRVEARSAASAASARALRRRAERRAHWWGARLGHRRQLGNALLGVGCARVHQRQLRHHVLCEAVRRVLDLSELLLGRGDHGVELRVVVVDLALEARQLHLHAVDDGIHRVLGVADRRLELQADACDRRGLVVQAAVDAAAPNLQSRGVDGLRRQRLLRLRKSCGRCCCHRVRKGGTMFLPRKPELSSATMRVF